jgi:acetyl esterase/lipase
LPSSLLLISLTLCAIAAEPSAAPPPASEAKAPAASKAPAVKPTLANVAYGKHERQVLDFYQAKSEKPTPVVFYIHGGGWINGDKAGFRAAPYLAEGSSRRNAKASASSASSSIPTPRA